MEGVLWGRPRVLEGVRSCWKVNNWGVGGCLKVSEGILEGKTRFRGGTVTLVAFGAVEKHLPGPDVQSVFLRARRCAVSVGNLLKTFNTSPLPICSTTCPPSAFLCTFTLIGRVFCNSSIKSSYKTHIHIWIFVDFTPTRPDPSGPVRTRLDATTPPVRTRLDPSRPLYVHTRATWCAHAGQP
eukprot:768394-Prorocentrum_minimum.AAC.1